MEINPEDGVKDVVIGQNTKKTAKIANVFQRSTAISLAARSVKRQKQETQAARNK